MAPPTAFLVLMLLAVGSIALPGPRRHSNQGQSISQRLGLPNGEKEPVYMRLDDVLDGPRNADPNVVTIISQGRVLGADNDDDNDDGDDDDDSRRISMTRMLSAHLQLVRDTVRGWVRRQRRRHDGYAEVAAAESGTATLPERDAVAEELRRRSDGGDRHAGPAGEVTAGMHQHARRARIRLYGYKHLPDPVGDAEST